MQAKVTPLSYTSDEAHENFEFELSFGPIYEVFGVFVDTIVQAKVFADVPKLDIAVSQGADVASNCQPAAACAASDLVSHNLTYVVLTLGLGIGFNTTDGSTSILQIGLTITLPTSCLDYLPYVKKLETVREKSNQGQRLRTGAGWRVDYFTIHDDQAFIMKR